MAATEQRLGPLQQAVLDYVWENPGSTVRECLESINGKADKPYAYTTILTVLDVLHRKGLVNRRRRKNAYCYTARKTKTLYLTEKLSELLASFSKTTDPVASSLVDALEGSDPAEIESLVAELKIRGHIS